jgi:DNA polymerase III alpha subunit
VINLVSIGALDTLVDDRGWMLASYKYRRAQAHLAESTLTNPTKLDNAVARRLTDAPDKWEIETPDFSDPNEVARIEKELLRAYITVDPMERYASALDATALAHPDDLRNFEPGAEVIIGGMVNKIKTHVVTKGRTKGKEMAFIEIDWNDEIFEVVAFPDIWSQVNGMIEPGVPVACDTIRSERGCVLSHMERLDWMWKELNES